jgi:hypothetical protein
VVHDPWLSGPTVLLASWFIYLGLTSTPAVSNGEGVEGIVYEIEKAAADAGVVRAKSVTNKDALGIDAIFINFHYSDHLHAPTLRTFKPSIPVFATIESAQDLRKLNHFDTIITYRDLNPDSFTGDWTTLHPGLPLPSYLTIFRILGHNELNFLSALIWTSSPSNHEAILHSPHGLKTSQPALQTLLHASQPKFSVLALLHGLKESWVFNWQTTYGVGTGLELYREAKAKYWVNTHSSELNYGGILWYFVTDVFRTVEWGLTQEKKGKEDKEEEEEEEEEEERREVEVIDVENGGCVVLE